MDIRALEIKYEAIRDTAESMRGLLEDRKLVAMSRTDRQGLQEFCRQAFDLECTIGSGRYLRRKRDMDETIESLFRSCEQNVAMIMNTSSSAAPVRLPGVASPASYRSSPASVDRRTPTDLGFAALQKLGRS